MNPDADASDLFPDFSPVPQMVFVNDSVSFQTEADQRVILVHGVVYSHYSREADYWVNDKRGDPLFVVTAEANAALTHMLPTNPKGEVRKAFGPEAACYGGL